MCRLRARRYEATIRQRTGGAVAKRIDIFIARGLQRLFYHQLVNAVGLQTANLFHKVRRFDACCPHHQIGSNILTLFGVKPFSIGAGHHGLRQNAHAQFGQLLMRRCRDTRRQRGQNAFTRFHQRDVERAAVEAFVAVAVQLLHRIVEFSGELHAGGAAANNGDIHFLQFAFAGGKTQELIQHLIMEATRLMRIVEEDAVIFHARRTKIVGRTAQRHHQTVPRQLTLWHQNLTLSVADFCQFNGFAVAVDLRQRSQLKLKAVVTGMGQIAQRIDALIHRTGRHLMQQRFPEMTVVTVNQNNLRFFAAAQLMPQLRCQLQAAGTSANNDDLFHGCSQCRPLKVVNQRLING